MTNANNQINSTPNKQYEVSWQGRHPYPKPYGWTRISLHKYIHDKYPNKAVTFIRGGSVDTLLFDTYEEAETFKNYLVEFFSTKTSMREPPVYIRRI